MDIISCGVIDSTSNYAAELLRQGHRPPFAVWAQSQTGGRGRRGHTWVSPEGNLYLTVALPSPSEKGDEDRDLYGCLPLKASVLVARLIEQKTGLRPTIKWPNDILFEAQKLGGLLLEMSSAGGKPGEILIGLGLNLNVAPSLEGPYKAISIASLMERGQDVGYWVKEIADGLWSQWQELPLEDVPRAFEDYGIASGSIWQKRETGALYSSKGVGAQGALTLVPWERGKEEILTSADHGFSWLYMGEGKTPLVVVDIGNSRLKIAVFGDPWAAEIADFYELAADAEESEIQQILDKIKFAWSLADYWPLHVLSVNPDGTDVFVKAAGKNLWTPLTITKRAVRRWGQGYEPQALGIDRMAAIEGYLARYSQLAESLGEDHAVIVSLGTATTIDVVAASGQHLGGWILPGMKTALKGLRQATKLLPLLDPQKESHLDLGHNTAQAMEQGVLNMTLGAVAQALLLLKDKDSAAPGIVLTGGYASLLLPHLKAKHIPDLALHGARWLVLAGA